MSKENEYRELKDWYRKNFELFESKLNGHSKSFLHEFRKNAAATIDKLSFPTVKNEEWKYTNITPILKDNFKPAFLLPEKAIDRNIIEKYLLKDFECNVLVFVNGIIEKEYSKLDCLPEGVIIDSLENILKTRPELVKDKLTKLSKIENNFNALNSVFALDGLFVFVPKNVIVEKPVQVLFLNAEIDEPILSSPRNLIIAEADSQVSIIANYNGDDGQKYFTNVITEVFTDENAIVDLYKIQDESHDAYHIEKVDIHQKKQSVFAHYSLSFGGSIVRNDLNTLMDAENIESHFYGLYLANENQLIDHHTFVDHAKPNCESNELYKGILDGNSRGVFNGKIMVRKDAQKTNAYQSNKTVLLSETARIDTKPQLEIFADDVKCSHGATVGHLDDEAYFYIRSRGVPHNLAKSMLIHAFANDVVEKIKIEKLREQVNHMIFEHLHQIEI